MRLARFRTVFAAEAAHHLTRPLFWSLILVLALFSGLFSTGDMQISTGDASVGGTKAWITSEFNFAFFLTMLVALIYGIFASIASGLAIPTDDENKVGDLLHSTPLRPGEYVWGKFLAVAFAFLVALALHVAFTIFFYHLVPSAEAAEIRGPFDIVNYLRPVVVFAIPTLVFLLGVAFYLGERLRRPLAVFLFPIAVLVACAFFLWDWSPTWLDPGVNRLLMWIDPAGFRWLNETWLKLDRGAAFYNTTRIGLDLPFVLSRIAFLGLGLLAVGLAQRHLAASLRGEALPASGRSRRLWRRGSQGAQGPATAQDESPEISARPAFVPLPALGMRTTSPGFWRGASQVAGTELRNLLASPALYIFAALILLQTLGNSLIVSGVFETRLLITPGQLAASSMGVLSFLLSLLLMFYTVESIERDRTTGLAALAYTAPTRTGSILFGKALANSVISVLMMAAAFVAYSIALLIQGTVGIDPIPFVVVWGLLLLPTVLVWTAFVTAVQAVTGQRYATYGICLAALMFTGIRVIEQKANWVGNWPLWGAVRWTDMGAFEMDRQALVLNRLMMLGLAVLFTAVAVRAFARRQPDSIHTLHRLQPRELWRQALRLSPFAVLPLVCGVMLWFAVVDGLEGKTMEKKGKDYWKQNLATWKDAPLPSVAGVDLDLRLDPQRHWFHTRGSYELVNDREEKPLRQIALSGGPHWEKLRWTLNGKPYEPENRSLLYVFTPPAPLGPGQRLRIGFDFEGRFPGGVTKNGGRVSEFILPSGVVLTSFSSAFAPLIGYQEGTGIKEGENDYEPRVYPDDFYEGRTDIGFGISRPYPTRIAVTGPAEYRYNSVGSLVRDEVKDGQRTMVWKSDQPVRLFNVIAGKWQERRGEGTVIYHHPEHDYNIDAMIEALDASRRYYSEWFHPFPWKELKLSEFPHLAGYAQGFPTNITFSEGIGFLTKPDVKANAVFMVTAHEAAHQWWGNILTPGEGPGGNVLSEGMSHFSTLLLIEQVKGQQARMELAKRFEERYGDRRRVDAERPMVKLDGSREGDETATYDKGGWVAWMLYQHMGRERNLAGLRKFIAEWKDGPDHPVLQDFVAAMRPFAPDPAAYDAFTKQWFFEVVAPEYLLEGAKRARRGDQPGAGWEVTVKVKNAGTGRMPVEVAATRGERFTEDGKPGKGYRDARSTVVLGAGEEKVVRIACPFEPESVVVDPDVQVLQLRRKAAVAGLS